LSDISSDTPTDELYVELSALSSTDRRLSASEERRRSRLVRELAGRDNTLGRQLLEDRYAKWMQLERADDRTPIITEGHS